MVLRYSPGAVLTGLRFLGSERIVKEVHAEVRRTRRTRRFQEYNIKG